MTKKRSSENLADESTFFIKKVVRKIFWGKWKANFFGEPSAPGPASALYAHAHNYAFTLFIDIMFNSDS